MIDNRLLFFNNQIVDIDDQTAIGIDIQAYDIKSPGSRKVSVSNNFTIPKTSNNLRILGFPGDPQSKSNIIYDFITVQYYNDNFQLIKNGNARITDVNERIAVYIYEKDSFWTLMSELLWPDFLQEFITWMQAEKGLPSASAPFTGLFQDFMDDYIDTTEGLFIPFYISNLARYSADSVNYLEDAGNLYLKYAPASVTGLGGHICIYCKTIFEFIEYKYGVDLSVNSTDYDYNLFQDVVAKAMYVPARNISVEVGGGGFYFSVDLTHNFLPEDNSEDKPDKSLYDFVKAFFQKFNALIDKVKLVSLTEKYVVRRFDDIIHAPTVDFSNGFSGKYGFKPAVDGYKQINYITSGTIYEGGSKLLNAKKIVCLNKNLDKGGVDSVLFSIDEYIPGSFQLGGDVCPDMSVAESFKTFAFFVSQGQASTNIKMVVGATTYTAAVILKIARSYSIDSEYLTVAQIASKPSLYTYKKYLSLLDVNKLVFFARYWVKELNGYYFINKISGFNPQKSNEPTAIELLKLP